VKQCDRISWGQVTSVYKNEFNFIFSIKTQTLGAALASPQRDLSVCILLLLSDQGGQYNRRRVGPSRKNKSFR